LKFLCKALFLFRIFEYFQLTPQSSARAPQQAADARQHALSHRIEGKVAESATGDYTPIIETTGEAHRMRAQAATGVSSSTDAPTRAKTGKR
jgi:hypothetical protein